MAIHEVNFTSFNEKDMIKGWIYTPIREPRGIVQIVHGFREHSRRYLHMILTLNEAGFVVAADDHVGHGKTANDSGNWSDWGDRGYLTLAEDEHILRSIVQEKYPDIPYFMFGHSLGSMTIRLYATVYGGGVDGIILCGTSGVFPMAKETATALEKEMEAGKGGEIHPEYLEMLMSKMGERITETDPSGDIVSIDPDIVTDHANDPFNNFVSPPNIRSVYYFAKTMVEIVGTEWAKKVPVSIPVYNIAGDQDPIGQYGEGVYAASNWLIDTGHDVTTKLYPGYRHEIHNHRNIRDEVEAGILAFMEGLLE